MLIQIVITFPSITNLIAPVKFQKLVTNWAAQTIELTVKKVMERSPVDITYVDTWKIHFFIWLNLQMFVPKVMDSRFMYNILQLLYNIFLR